jgi:2,5-furandicarboxylate decarboxylase 1
VANLFGSYDLLGLALDVPHSELSRWRRDLVLEVFRTRQANPLPVKEVAEDEAPVREVVWQGDDVTLDRFPITKQAQLNSGKYVPIGLTILRDPDNGRINVGVYRQEVKGPKRLACMIVSSHHGAAIARRYAELGEKMPVVTIIGHHPATAIAAASTRPQTIEDEFQFIGGILGESLEVTRGLTVDLPVPARAEICIEGIIDPLQIESEGPFSEGAGYYGEGKPCYVAQLTAISMRKDAIYHDLNPVHQEHNLVGLLQRELNLWGRVEAAGVDVRSVHIGPDGQCGKVIMYIAIRKKNPDDARKAGEAAVSGDFAKVAIVVDDDIDVFDQGEVLWAVATRSNDTDILTAVPTRNTGPAEDVAGLNSDGGRLAPLTSKLIIDATRPIGKVKNVRVVPPHDVWERLKLEDCFKKY